MKIPSKPGLFFSPLGQAPAGKAGLPSLQKMPSVFSASVTSGEPLVTSAILHPLKADTFTSSLHFEPSSARARTTDFLTRLFAVTAAATALKIKQAQPAHSGGVNANQHPLSIGFQFRPDRPLNGHRLLVFEREPMAYVPAAVRVSSTTQLVNAPAFDIPTTNLNSGNITPTLQARPFASSPAGIFRAENSPATKPMPYSMAAVNSSPLLKLSPIEAKALGGIIPLATALPTLASRSVQATRSQPLGPVIDEVTTNPFAVLSRKLKGDIVSAAVATSSFRKPAAQESLSNPSPLSVRPGLLADQETTYRLVASQRIINPNIAHLPLELQLIAQADHRLQAPNSVLRYGYLPASKTVLTQEMLGQMGIQAHPRQGVINILSSLQKAFSPLLTRFPALNFGKFSLDTTEGQQAFWAGDHRLLPLITHTTGQGEEIHLYDLTLTPNGQLAQVIKNAKLDTREIDLGVQKKAQGAPLKPKAAVAANAKAANQAATLSTKTAMQTQPQPPLGGTVTAVTQALQGNPPPNQTPATRAQLRQLVMDHIAQQEARQYTLIP